MFRGINLIERGCDYMSKCEDSGYAFITDITLENWHYSYKKGCEEDAFKSFISDSWI